MLKNTLPKLIATFAVFALLVPVMASAHEAKTVTTTNDYGVTVTTKVADTDEDSNEDEDTDEDNNKDAKTPKVRTLEGRHDNGKHLGWFKDHSKNHDGDEDEDNDSEEANARAQGEVTAVNDNGFMIQSDADSEIQVNVTDDTEYVDAEGDATTRGDIDEEDNVKVFGFWDDILNVFNAIKVRLF
jgi:hypothetical protein